MNSLHTSAGFTLLELMMVTAIIGVLASIALPNLQVYTVRAKVTEGLFVLRELQQRVEVDFYDTEMLSFELPGTADPDGSLFGGPFYNYSTLFGQEHDVWQRVEYQPKGPHRVIALRAWRKPEWNNSDIGIHLQVRVNADNTLDFRCTVNNVQSRMEYLPPSCREGNVNDWTGW